MKRKKCFKIGSCLLSCLILVATLSFPSLAASKTQTITKAGTGFALDATMKFDLLYNGTVANGVCTKVVKNSNFWFSVYNNHGKHPYRYDSNGFYGVRTTGFWADFGEKGSIVNLTITGFR